jgi:hypothetical protein
MFARGSSMHQKCPNHTLINLLFGLCKFVWIIDQLVIRFSPHHKVPARPSTPKVLWTKERTLTPYPYVVYTFGLEVESIKEFRGASLTTLQIQKNLPYLPFTTFKGFKKFINFLQSIKNKNKLTK